MNFRVADSILRDMFADPRPEASSALEEVSLALGDPIDPTIAALLAEESAESDEVARDALEERGLADLVAGGVPVVALARLVVERRAILAEVQTSLDDAARLLPDVEVLGYGFDVHPYLVAPGRRRP